MTRLEPGPTVKERAHQLARRLAGGLRRYGGRYADASCRSSRAEAVSRDEQTRQSERRESRGRQSPDKAREMPPISAYFPFVV
jgi:hypothetical protein